VSQLPTALGLGIRELAQALVLVASGAATIALACVAAARGRWRALRRRRGTLSAGPWAPAGTGVRVLLEGGPARFRAGPLTIVVEDGGALAIRARRRRPPPVGTVVVGSGCTLRVAAYELSDPDDSAAARALWLCAGDGDPPAPAASGRRAAVWIRRLGG
jgi:hypothetical protein